MKGKYHEILYVHRENNDGDEWRAELILPSNHEGSDIRSINEWTGEVVEKQIKAGNIAGIRGRADGSFKLRFRHHRY